MPRWEAAGPAPPSAREAELTGAEPSLRALPGTAGVVPGQQSELPARVCSGVRAHTHPHAAAVHRCLWIPLRVFIPIPSCSQLTLGLAVVLVGPVELFTARFLSGAVIQRPGVWGARALCTPCSSAQPSLCSQGLFPGDFTPNSQQARSDPSFRPSSRAVLSSPAVGLGGEQGPLSATLGKETGKRDIPWNSSSCLHSERVSVA